MVKNSTIRLEYCVRIAYIKFKKFHLGAIESNCDCMMGKHYVLIEWIDKEKGDSDENRVNVKHLVIEDPQDISVGAVVRMRHHGRLFRGIVKDLLDWKPPKKVRKRKDMKKQKKDCTKNFHRALALFGERDYPLPTVS